MADRLQVVDGDGHLVTDIAAVASRMPQEYLNRAGGSNLGSIFRRSTTFTPLNRS